jgi:uncharacterized protein (TIRG00374 family)
MVAKNLDKSVQNSPIPKQKLVWGTALFMVLTAGIFGYLFATMDGSAGPTWSSLQWEWGLLLLLALPLDPGATSARMWAVCRVLAPDVSYWTCFKADCANFAMSTITPGQSGGGVAQVYMLNREGVPTGTAWTLSMISFLGTLVGLAIIGLYALLVTKHPIVTGTLFTAAVWTVAVAVALMGIFAYLPGLIRVPTGMLSRALARLTRRTHRLEDWHPPGSSDGAPVDRMGRFATTFVNVLYTYSNDIPRFLKNGKLAFLGVIAGTLGFLVARGLVAYCCLRFLGLDGGLVEVMGIQMALTFVVYFSPTPGGAGVAESVSLIVMAAFVPDGFAAYYNLLWRFATIYFWAIAGGIFLAQAVFRSARPRYFCPSTQGAQA